MQNWLLEPISNHFQAKSLHLPTLDEFWDFLSDLRFHPFVQKLSRFYLIVYLRFNKSNLADKCMPW